MAPRVDEKYREEIEKARTELETAISKEKSSARNLLRSAYAYQFSIANHDPDATKSTATNHNKTIEKIHNDHPTITYPDLYQLAGVVAVKELQGPEIKFVPGREDLPISPDDSCLPNLKQSPSELRECFSKVKISETKNIVALYGGLKLATAGDQDANSFVHSHVFFENLVNRKDLSPSDEALLKDEECSNFVKRYAKNKDEFVNNYKAEFFENYKDAHKNLFEVVLPRQNVFATIPRVVGVGVAVAAAVLIFSVFYLINKRRTQHPSQQFQ